MRLLFFTEARLKQSPKGRFYSADQSFSYQMFKRYLTVFDDVLVVARCTDIEEDVENEDTRVEGSGIKVAPLPFYIGPYQYLIARNKLIRKLRYRIDTNPDAAIICRVPGTIGNTVAKYLGIQKRPYGVEVVGDPADVFAPGSFHHPFRAVFQYSGIRNLKTAVKGAAASIYVTKAALQSRYPNANNTFSTNASNVMLLPESFAGLAKTLKKESSYLIVSVGTLAAMYKSPDIAIRAMRILKDKGLPVTFQWLGGGRYLPEMVALAEQFGVSDIMTFVGSVSSVNEVRNYLDSADLFVLPSRQEGLPRALIEAMARGLPCIGTDIGGIPEILEKQALVPINNPLALADKVSNFLNSPRIADAQAKRNLKAAHSYAFEHLEAKRKEFYTYLKRIS